MTAVRDRRGRLGPVKVEILVRPNSSRDLVGGTHDGALVVRVVAPADGGRATRAALQALAETLGIPKSQVSLIRGATSRRKMVEIGSGRTGPEQVESRLRSLYRREC